MIRSQSSPCRPESIHQPSRRGTILVMFMLSLLLLSMTIAALMRVSLTQRDIVQGEQLSLQAEWLFQSAVARASAGLKSDASYTGEKWSVSAEELGQPYEGIAEIQVENKEGETNRKQVLITVNYPNRKHQRARVSRTVSISL